MWIKYLKIIKINNVNNNNNYIKYLNKIFFLKTKKRLFYLKQNM